MSTPDWYGAGFPELRPGPPWVMQEMIAAEPALIEQLLREPPEAAEAIAGTIASALERCQPVVVCGCGTSEHAAQAIAVLLSGAAGPGRAHLIRARAALPAALAPRGGVCLAVSHDGETRATTLALKTARESGARTIAITHSPQSGVARAAEQTLVTPRHDDSWCHTIAYTSAIASGAALATRIGPLPASPDSAGRLLETASTAGATTAVAGRLAARRVVLCAGAQADHISARELALKIAEGARMPTVGLELETVLHGQLAGHEADDALILVAITDHPDRGRLIRRAAQVARAAAAIGLPVAGLLSEHYAAALDGDLTPAGRIVIGLPDPDVIDHRLAGLLAGAGALQALTLSLADARHTNPDLIRREQSAYRDAAAVAEDPADW
jgi:glutamine---fructose-6-phosphate transaminase (isomerizing)